MNRANCYFNNVLKAKIIKETIFNIDFSGYVKSVQNPYLRNKRVKRTHRVSGVIAHLFLNLGTRRGYVVSIMPRPPLPPVKTWYPLYRRLGGPRSQSG